MSDRSVHDLEALRVQRDCLVWLDGLGAAAGATQPLESSVRSGSGVESLIAMLDGEVFFVECLASRQIHRRRSHEHQQARFTVQRAHCFSVRSAQQLEQFLRAHFANRNS